MNLKQFNKDFIQEKYKKYKKCNKKVIMILSVFIVIAMIYSALHTDDEIDLDENIENNITQTAIKSGKYEANYSAKMVYAAPKNEEKLQNPFSFAHEDKDIKEVRRKNDKSLENKTENNKILSANYEIKEKTVKVKYENKDIRNNKTGDKNKYNLVAILDLNERKTAIIKTEDKNIRVHEGDRIDNFIVDYIGKNDIKMRDNQDNLSTYKLNGF